MYLVNTRRLRHIYPRRTWLSTSDDRLHLTFDDGPHPDSTPAILAVLRAHGIRATFFCLGKQIEQHPKLYQQILADGHLTGNHTYQHLNGWKSSTDDYLTDVQRCSTLCDSQLFRPPYGRITRRQEKALMDLGYQIVMWSLMPGDWDPALPLATLKERLSQRKKDDIIVLHDQGRPIVTELLTWLVKH